MGEPRDPTQMQEFHHVNLDAVLVEFPDGWSVALVVSTLERPNGRVIEESPQRFASRAAALDHALAVVSAALLA